APGPRGRTDGGPAGGSGAPGAGMAPARKTAAVPPMRRRPLVRPAYGSVLRQARVDVLDPAQDAAPDVDGVGEPGVLQHRQDLGGPAAGLAVQDDLLVLGQPLQRRAVQELALGDEHRARDAADLVLVGLADVDEHDVLAPVE